MQPQFPKHKRLSKRKVRQAAQEGFWEGFWGELSGSVSLSYASDSGWYSYNEVRRIADEGGREFARDILAKRDRRQSKDATLAERIISPEFKIPAEVWANVWAEAGQ